MKKRKLGIAFGGGGSKGIAHLGVIKAFEEEGITFDEISGTSAGSIVGALYAYGLKFDEMYQVLKTINMKDIKSGPIFFMPSDTSGIEDLIKSSIGNINFDELAKPLTVVAVDLISGEEVHLKTGNVAKAVAASCAVPGFFKPVEHMGYHLVDGGLQNNIPADLLRKNGCDVVISVDVNHSRGKGTTSTKLLDVLSASMGIMMKSNSLNGKIYSDIVIEPDLRKYNRTKLDGYDEMIEIAYQETKKKMPEIKKMLGLDKTQFWQKIFGKRKKEVLEEKESETLEL